jgi:hypothetical protein
VQPNPYDGSTGPPAGGKDDLASKRDPSNPFKKSGRPTTPAPARPVKGDRQGTPSTPPGGGQRAPPTPPGGSAKKAPPTPPGGGQKKAQTPRTPAPRAPAKSGRSVGLRKPEAKSKADLAKRTDERAKALIEATRTRVNKEVAAKAESAQAARKKGPDNPFKKKAGGPAKPAGRRPGHRYGNKRNKPQGPTKRTLKLHRGKYMEFKYDVRRILEDEKVEDEHRSNVLGQTWAKGERQGIPEAKNFLSEQVEKGVIAQSCADKILRLIDSLTTRR